MLEPEVFWFLVYWAVCYALILSRPRHIQNDKRPVATAIAVIFVAPFFPLIFIFFLLKMIMNR